MGQGLKFHLYPDTIFKWGKKKSKPDESLYCDWFSFHFFLFSFQYSSILSNHITWQFFKISFLFHLFSLCLKLPELLLLDESVINTFMTSAAKQRFSFPRLLHTRSEPSRGLVSPWYSRRGKENYITASTWFPLIPIFCSDFLLKKQLP